MLGRGFRSRQARPAAVLLAGVLLSGGLHGCYWLKYEKLMRTHIELMLSLSEKLTRRIEASAAASDAGAFSPAMMNEFFYPLERARDFVRIVEPRYAGRDSLAAFRQMLERYERVVREADRLRVQPGPLDDFHLFRQAFREQAVRVETALASE